jgi:hypothetical protein
MPLLVPLAILLFLAPGYFLSLLLGSRARWASALILSLLVLFYGVFLSGVCGLPIRFEIIAVYLLAVAAGAALAVRRWVPPMMLPDKQTAPPPSLQRLALGAVVLIGAGLLLRCALQPLTGYDTSWRWDFLAQRVQERQRFDYYPPRSPQDFAVYFYAESIPPLVSFSYWWLYAAAGRHVAELTALLVVAQYAACAWLTYRTGIVLFSRRAGLFAVIVLATSLLFYRALAIGQETGLTALSMIGLTYFIVSAREGTDYRAMILGGLSAALGALSREYGYAFLACGLVTLLWRRRSWREALVYGLTACAAAGPWYVRTLLLTGNPLYSNRLLGLSVNTIQAALIDFYRERLSVRQWSAAQWMELGRYLLSYAPVQCALGLPAAVILARRHGYLGFGALLVIGLGLSSVGYTSGGTHYAMRVLAPALVLLSVLAGALLDRLRSRSALTVASLLLVVLFARSAVYAFVHPATLALAPTDWLAAAMHHEPNAPVPPNTHEELLPELLAHKLPPGMRILAENVFAHAALAGTDYEVVPVWSPEMSFLFDKSLSADEIHRRLWDRGIRAVVFNAQSYNTHYLIRESPFYRDAPDGWIPLVALKGTATVVYELPPPQ